MTVQQLLGTHPRPVGDLEPAARCIEACAECATACTICADADIAEPDVAQMLRCSRLCLDCADVCTVTGRVVGRQTQRDVGVLRAILEACKTACRVSGEECERHASHHEHCGICAASCRRCEEACDALLAVVA